MNLKQQLLQLLNHAPYINIDEEKAKKIKEHNFQKIIDEPIVLDALQKLADE